MAEFGTYNPNGSIQAWPAVDINGNGYTYPPTTVRVSTDKFVVVPANPSVEVWQQVEAIKAELAKQLDPATEQPAELPTEPVIESFEPPAFRGRKLEK